MLCLSLSALFPGKVPIAGRYVETLVTYEAHLSGVVVKLQLFRRDL